jgi:hypothetical protein
MWRKATLNVAQNLMDLPKNKNTHPCVNACLYKYYVWLKQHVDHKSCSIMHWESQITQQLPDILCQPEMQKEKT